MIKLMTVLMALAFAIGCGGKKPAETTTTNKDTSTSNTDPNQTTAAPTGEGTPCAQEVALVCPDGQTDGCLKTPAEGDTHKCVAK